MFVVARTDKLCYFMFVILVDEFAMHHKAKTWDGKQVSTVTSNTNSLSLKITWRGKIRFFGARQNQYHCMPYHSSTDSGKQGPGVKLLQRSMPFSVSPSFCLADYCFATNINTIQISHTHTKTHTLFFIHNLFKDWIAFCDIYGYYKDSLLVLWWKCWWILGIHSFL